jgi:hypothetical protein
VSIGLLAAASGARGVELHSIEFHLFGGVGGSNDADPGDGFSNQALEFGVLVPTEPGTQVGVRAGMMTIDGPFGRYVDDTELQYVHIAGEYRFFEGYYTSGIFIGLGGYRLEGVRPGGQEDSEDAFGLAVGVTGDFPITRHLAFGLQITGHYIDFDDQQLFATALGGISLRF